MIARFQVSVKEWRSMGQISNLPEKTGWKPAPR